MEKNITNFTVLCIDTPVADVVVTEGAPKIKKLVPDGIMQPFCGPRQDMMRIYDFLKSRCYEDGRADLKDILEQAGLSDNNPWNWAKVTHGVTWDDFWWIRFPGETLTWKDVKLR